MAYQRALECGGQPEFYWDRTGFFVNVVKMCIWVCGSLAM